MIVFVLLLISYFAFSLYVANAMTAPLAPRIDTSAKVVSENFEDVSFDSTDGLELKGWLFTSSSNKLVIMVTGLLPNRVNTEYLGPMIGKELVERGYNLLLYDTRAHGQSAGERVGYGSVEGNDVVGAVQFAKSRGFEPENIGIIADSTGAISTLMVIDQLKEVRAVVLDSTATEFQPIISETLGREKKIPPFFHPAIFFFDKVVFGVDLSVIRPIEKIKLVPERNFLFLHGALDETIPLKNSQGLLAAAKPESKLVVFENGGHTETYKSDPDLYRREVFGFLTEELGKN